MELSEHVYYDESRTTWLRRTKDWRCGRNGCVLREVAGTPVGWEHHSGYIVVRVAGKLQQVHRVVWELHFGEIPEGMHIDHINGVRCDNRIDNLRLVLPSVNTRNSKKYSTNDSGVTGVSLLVLPYKEKEYQYWRAHWKDSMGRQQAKTFNIGTYSYEEAFDLACKYREEMVNLLNANGAGYTEDHGKRIS